MSYVRGCHNLHINIYSDFLLLLYTNFINQVASLSKYIRTHKSRFISRGEGRDVRTQWPSILTYLPSFTHINYSVILASRFLILLTWPLTLCFSLLVSLSKKRNKIRQKAWMSRVKRRRIVKLASNTRSDKDSVNDMSLPSLSYQREDVHCWTKVYPHLPRSRVKSIYR